MDQLYGSDFSTRASDRDRCVGHLSSSVYFASHLSGKATCLVVICEAVSNRMIWLLARVHKRARSLHGHPAPRRRVGLGFHYIAAAAQITNIRGRPRLRTSNHNGAREAWGLTITIARGTPSDRHIIPVRRIMLNTSRSHYYYHYLEQHTARKVIPLAPSVASYTGRSNQARAASCKLHKTVPSIMGSTTPSLPTSWLCTSTCPQSTTRFRTSLALVHPACDPA
ncbi:hypothetical protein CBOM_07827 [Ceraceosorus bombacis]|uniref:Uncharacterized protein n=1 Tax=Ceraceosorus bombacis TaxID=401625 RepID=A0A0P1BNU9_9BASI|nr:hypothetical protein CBOM_07827 [Ceraceosorus bombacis]